ncbi:hypothetical protein [Flaviaesturariibacter aridisoli]|uniref:Lipocalin-like domain-containing protein n=1 Tax=Flaviaesturariibacter aridisoli TaxID=2545761 RepID=A0A4R4E1C8_9BACT|nr:hypothetical protein [Flaviaesturariibacter aridisoli]TCZ73149.1 hypothetical protein E0486_07295 [Flaviaesturariibacter aridisoli]
MKNTILFLLPLLAACSKGGRADSGPPPEGAWLQTEERANGQNLWCEYYYDPCRFDDRWIFYPDGRYEVADSGQRCAPGLGGVRSGSWQLEGSTLWLDGSAYLLLRGGHEFRLRQERRINGVALRYELGFTRP